MRFAGAHLGQQQKRVHGSRKLLGAVIVNLLDPMFRWVPFHDKPSNWP